MNEPPQTDLKATALPPHRPLSQFYPSTAARRDFVNELFDQAAPDYDWVSGIMSLGSDRAYRRDALRRAGLRSGMRLLDVATGTGLMIKAALDLGVDPALVTGVDPSSGMLAQNRARHPVTLLQGHGEALPCADATFDCVCMGYALRHVEDLNRLFGEFRRVLRPEGRLLILEITRPSNPVAFWAMRFYMQTLMPRVGWLRRRSQSTARLMEYYWATIEECVPPSIITESLKVSGFRNVMRNTAGSVLSEYTAQR